MRFFQISYIIILIFLFNITLSKDISTFSNYKIIQQTNIEVNFDIDFTQKIINGNPKIYFKALSYGEVIVLDTKALNIYSVIDSDTGEKLNFTLDEQYKLSSLGVPLKIYKEFNKDDLITIVIKFSTTSECTAIDWLDPEQTSGKIYPFMYSQCQSIYCRELLPVQDTPAVKMPVYIGVTVVKPLLGLVGGIYRSEIDNGDTVTYFYEQKIPIPSYLITIAAGDLEMRQISDRTKIYAEREIVDKAAYEFSDTENYIELIEQYTFAYEWGEYNILVLPPSFPFGGMENPCLTFVSPSFIAGDKSLSWVIAHEISHSWSGNLVTMENWSDFWLNEGFTMFLERKIIERFLDKDMAKLNAMVSYSSYKDDVYAFGESKSFTSLRPYLVGRHPDDSFCTVPYEKGFNFVYYLENLINSNDDEGKDVFMIFMRRYLKEFKYGVVDYYQFRNYFEKFINNTFPTKSENILSQIDWRNWVEAPGFPPLENNFTNIYSTEVEKIVELFYKEELDDNFAETFKNWFTLLKQIFLNRINDKGQTLTDWQFNYLTNILNLTSGYNVEVEFSYFMLILKYGKNISQNVENALIDFLGHHGRINYLRPIYSEFYKRNKQSALATLNKYRSFYHAIVIKYIELDLKLIG